MAQSWAAQSSSSTTSSQSNSSATTGAAAPHAATTTHHSKSTAQRAPPPLGLFKCSVCDKEFEQRSSRDRHQRRCRQKQISGTIPRKKSCAICTQAKTRCDLLTPSCSRCKNKGLDCHYYHQPPPQHSHPHNHNYNHHYVTTPTTTILPRTTTLVHRRSPVRFSEELSLPTPACTDNSLSEDLSDGSFRHTSGSSNNGMGDVEITDWGDINHNLLEWNIFAGSVEDMELHSICAIGNVTPVSPQGPYQHPYNSNHPGSPTDQQIRFAPRQVSIESFKQMRKRLVETVPAPGPKNKFIFIDRVCRGYPKMMTGRNGPPPFIHSSHLIPGRMTSALANCRGLVDMYKAMTPDNRSFVMKSIASEHARILAEAEHVRVCEAEKIGVLQAALIYGLIRHFENDPTFDKAAMDSMETMAVNVSLAGLVAKGELEGTRPVWEDWIIAESKRRTMIALYMLDGSFHYARNIPTFTCSDLRDLLLPTLTTLWQSRERSKWEYEYENYLSDLRGRSLPKVADILSTESAYFSIEEWISGMDNFGVTVLAMVEESREDTPEAVEEGI
ncbi:hypothetical protein L873DRAFT_1758446 [Choiromyces venosus 120613-1]|uniref:Zn(2)-C6 fungal-type domain-containing protein n=1 Tax=Choiromyces venosus 120613-1 TaxID=1336337 RepID=A0A3N4K3C9_9PEZI|nr:hypothetical protein L873DRAFT_1758446 [Choiromyces venosus 120613-1]